MKVLIACEESQIECMAFRELGHEAYSCDIQEPSGGHPEWHILGDALEAMKGGRIVTMDGISHDVGKWDMMIAHPPCTKMSKAGACWMYKRPGIVDPVRLQEALAAKAFFMALWKADIPRVVVENPRPLKIVGLPPHTQVVQPYEHGEPYSKETLLWERGVCPLRPTNIITEYTPYVPSNTSKHSKGAGGSKGAAIAHNASDRSKAFPGIAKAMAEQWGGDIRKEEHHEPEDGRDRRNAEEICS